MQNDYLSFFEELVNIVQKDNKPWEEIKQHALLFERKWDKDDFNVFKDQYVRTYIGKDPNTKWEALVMSWKKGNSTQIHGHPFFASYTGLRGEILVEVFEAIDINKCKKVSEYMVRQGISLYAVGEPDQFCNHIHRLTCLSDTAHSLHIYSDDALKGKLYSE